MIGAILGFFIWNYPKGSIFLGDGGSYLIGFWIAVLSVLLVARNPSVSPWFALLVNIYPIFETLFTIYRRKIHQGRNISDPDAIHFHSLLYRRVLKIQFGNTNSEAANARTSPYLWVLSGLPVILGIFFWKSTPSLFICIFIFILFYLWTYKRIVTFKTPKWLHLF
jgi:UDP-N-acetylmuramyl pentapeptide phosphotransferase/UDP-N-acetylglucosamine-1-phosphate transferase